MYIMDLYRELCVCACVEKELIMNATRVSIVH